MMYGLVIDGKDAEHRKASLTAALETLRRDLCGDLDNETRRFFAQGKLLLTVGEPRKDLIAKVTEPVDLAVKAMAQETADA